MTRSHASPPPPRHGMTLLELLVVLALTSVVLGMAVPRIRAAIDRGSVRSAALDASSSFGYARRLAVTRRSAVAVRMDSARGRIVIHALAETLAVRSLRDRYGVTIRSTRDSLAFDARGLGYGAANLSVVFERGRASETLFVARLGRIRR